MWKEKVTMFDMTCPYCRSKNWRSYERDEKGVNLKIQCLECNCVRVRKQEPIDDFPSFRTVDW